MFRNMNSSLIISIGISLILCSAIVYYCNMRLNNVETAIMRQNQVLSSFIANVQNEFRRGGEQAQENILSEDVSTPEARQSAEAQSNKIVVSDDDDDDDDGYDSSSESDTDNESDNENDNDNKIIINRDTNKDIILDNDIINVKEINLNNDTETHFIKIVDMTDLTMFTSMADSQHNTQSTIYEIKDDDDEDEDDDDSSESDDEDSKKVNEIKIKVEPVDKIEEHTTQAPLKIEQMRVDDLRKMVLEQKLSTKEEVKKLKKPELLFLLKQPSNV